MEKEATPKSLVLVRMTDTKSAVDAVARPTSSCVKMAMAPDLITVLKVPSVVLRKVRSVSKPSQTALL